MATPSAAGRRWAAGLLIGAYFFAFVIGIAASVFVLMGTDLSASGDGSAVSSPYDWDYVIAENGLTFVAFGLMAGAQAFLVADGRPSLSRLGAPRTPDPSAAARVHPSGVVVAAAAAVYSLCLVAAQILQQLLLSHDAGLPAPTSDGTPTAAAMILAAHAGIAEEVIVVGGLVVAVGLFTQRAIIALPILIAARLAYHLYYGWAVVPLILWAAVSAYIIWRWRSWTIIAGFIVLHVAWDALIHWPMWAQGNAILYLYGVPAVVVLVGCFILDRRWWSTPPAIPAPRPSDPRPRTPVS